MWLWGGSGLGAEGGLWRVFWGDWGMGWVWGGWVHGVVVEQWGHGVAAGWLGAWRGCGAESFVCWLWGLGGARRGCGVRGGPVQAVGCGGVLSWLWGRFPSRL